MTYFQQGPYAYPHTTGVFLLLIIPYSKMYKISPCWHCLEKHIGFGKNIPRTPKTFANTTRTTENCWNDWHERYHMALHILLARQVSNSNIRDCFHFCVSLIGLGICLCTALPRYNGYIGSHQIRCYKLY